ncbi:hypothetical protein BKA70DRAFT_1526885 [Coprinopsis sp. MPI-PUGE-AT-0042]|nr:hypothetical protein BKA70DRAFT_1526885 [Coprinopsis sp. MPI-PUGE-AT-0042]
MSVVREELHRQAEYLRTLQAKNIKLTSELSYLRERNQSIEVLLEEKRGLPSWSGRTSSRRRLQDLKRKSKLVDWNARHDANNDNNNAPSSIPISITQPLTDLRLARAQLLEELGATTASLRQRTAELASLESQNTQHQKVIQALEAEVRAAKEELRRKDSRVMLVEREVGYLQALLASFKAEEACGDSATPAVDQVKVDKMDQLEALLAEYKNVNDQLANDLEALEGPMVSTEELEKVEQERKVLRQTISEHEQEIQAQATKIDELELALFELSGEIAGGRHVPPKTWVLCMKNGALIKRLKELEESGVSCNPASQRRRQAGAAWLWLSLLRLNVIPPTILGRAYEKLSSKTQSLLGDASTALNVYTIESEVEGRWFEVERDVSSGGTVCSTLDTYRAVIGGSNPRLDFGESSIETIARSLTDGEKTQGAQLPSEIRK